MMMNKDCVACKSSGTEYYMVGKRRNENDPESEILYFRGFYACESCFPKIRDESKEQKKEGDPTLHYLKLEEVDPVEQLNDDEITEMVHSLQDEMDVFDRERKKLRGEEWAVLAREFVKKVRKITTLKPSGFIFC